MVMTRSSVTAQGNDSFRRERTRWGHVLVCAPLLAVARHAFTTRDVAVGTSPDDLERGYAAIADLLGVSPERVYDARQVHGAGVFVARKDSPRHHRADADLLVAGDPGLAVVVRVADCVPILLADPLTGAVGAVHAGWRGTCAGAATAAVETLQARFGARPERLIAAIGPSIGPCCYQVGQDVVDAFARSQRLASPTRSNEGEAVRTGSEAVWFHPDGPGHWRLDLWAANRQQLVAAGVRKDGIHVAGECTATRVDRYYSFRVEGARAGRLLAAISPARSADRTAPSAHFPS
jgi:YfiH family protein